MRHLMYDAHFRWLRNLTVALITLVANVGGGSVQVGLGNFFAKSIGLVKTDNSEANIPGCSQTPLPENLSSGTLLAATAIGCTILVGAYVSIIYLVTIFIKTDSDLIRDLLPEDDHLPEEDVRQERIRRISRAQYHESPFHSTMARLVPPQVFAMVGTYIGLLILNKDTSNQLQTGVASTTTGLASIGSITALVIYLAREFYHRFHRNMPPMQSTVMSPTIATDILVQTPVVVRHPPVQHACFVPASSTIATPSRAYFPTTTGFFPEHLIGINGAAVNSLPMQNRL